MLLQPVEREANRFSPAREGAACTLAKIAARIAPINALHLMSALPWVGHVGKFVTGAKTSLYDRSMTQSVN